jgi:hypothetical protein
MPAVRLGNCENVQDYASKNAVYMNGFNLCADSDRLTGGGGIMQQSKHTYYTMMCIPTADDWWVFTQLMYNKIDSVAN